MVSNIKELGLLQVNVLDVERCLQYLSESAQGINIIDLVLRSRGRSNDMRLRKAFVQQQLRLQARCDDADAITLEPINALHRVMLGLQCFDAVTLGQYLGHQLEESDAFRQSMVVFAISRMQGQSVSRSLANLDRIADNRTIDARNPLTNEQLSIAQLRRLNRTLEQILQIYEWVIQTMRAD